MNFTDELIKEGKLVEAGWIGLRTMILPPDTPEYKLVEIRKAFFAGAQHLYASIMHVLDPGDDPTEADLRRMQQIDKELRLFGEQLVREIQTQGEA